MSTLHVIHFGSQALMVCDCSAAVMPIHARQGACTICGHSFAMIELLLPSGVVRVPLAQIGMMDWGWKGSDESEKGAGRRVCDFEAVGA